MSETWIAGRIRSDYLEYPECLVFLDFPEPRFPPLGHCFLGARSARLRPEDQLHQLGRGFLEFLEFPVGQSDQDFLGFLDFLADQLRRSDQHRLADLCQGELSARCKGSYMVYLPCGPLNCGAPKAAAQAPTLVILREMKRQPAGARRGSSKTATIVLSASTQKRAMLL